MMKYHSSSIAAAIAALATISTSHAALTVIPGYTNPGPDGNPFLYEAKGTFSDNSVASWNVTTTVGGWSYVDLDPVKNQNRGWGHTASWYLVEIQHATQFQLSMTSTDAAARPGFVIYLGESVNDAPAAAHTFSNNGNDLVLLNDGWDNNGPGNAPGLSYVTHGFNATGNSVGGSVYLAPGLYTIAVGNGANSTTAPTDKTFDLVMAVPEPSSLLLTLLGGLFAFKRRRA